MTTLHWGNHCSHRQRFQTACALRHTQLTDTANDVHAWWSVQSVCRSAWLLTGTTHSLTKSLLASWYTDGEQFGSWLVVSRKCGKQRVRVVVCLWPWIPHTWVYSVGHWDPFIYSAWSKTRQGGRDVRVVCRLPCACASSPTSTNQLFMPLLHHRVPSARLS